MGILFEYGDGSFIEQTDIFIQDNSYSTSIATSALNSDKCLDSIVACFGSKSVLVFYGYGNGTYEEPQSYVLGYGSFLYSLALGDFNSDNWLDIAVVNYGADTVDILLQTCNSS
ncbi:unnamed protein product [Rotaria magnacalcarata]|uniref:VCBS repeat-containing protein n=1 Tax=Rotaria magnacalcarata TaxID=392030 RepID=A0A819B6H8_9BILA|nr:unnamed protein product [Rotaria magnacalcarata]CAF2114126.1 unnamed protein product [Rotaria magnacalcarata]CAF3796815.1 unnamed protein product [Rotaria magnacalcarata]CAF4370146.1 unnamed protein product [Rotaria magnacalcarata]